MVGPEAELSEENNLNTGQIPIELWDVPNVERRETEVRDVTPAPALNTGVNLDTIRPAIFAPSVAGKLMIEMPLQESGNYATGTISTSVTAAARAKSADVPQTAGAITTASTGPHRIGASIGWAAEDIASIGQDNFEAVTRGNVSLVLSDALDNQMLNGTGQGDDLFGIFQRLDNPAVPAANVETWTRFLKIQSSGVDGLWASELAHIAMLVGVETYQLAAATFQGADSEESAASYLKRMGAPGMAFQTNKRMPAKVAHVQQGIVCRKGRTGLRTAVAPHWGYLSIDDIYSGARKGERYFTVSVLVGDVILVQPDAYAQVAFRVSA